MLFDPEAVNFASKVLVFVHIPKTAGSSFRRAIVGHFGAEVCLSLRQEKIEKLHPDAAHALAWRARELSRRLAKRLVGGHPLLPKSGGPAARTQIRLVAGHVVLGREPPLSREPIYVTLVRDPIERFVSHFYFLQDLGVSVPGAASWGRSGEEFGLEDYVDLLVRRKLRTVNNVQCGYIAGRESFACARRVIDERVFLAAPCERLQDFLELLRPVLGADSMPVARENVGRARAGAPAPSAAIRDKIGALLAEDIRLFDYVSDRFDELYRQNKAKAARFPATGRSSGSALG